MNKKGTGDMPKPQCINYDEYYSVTNDFINDLTASLSGSDKSNELTNLENELNAHLKNNVFPIAIVNEIIRRISVFPYVRVKGIMNVIENDFGKYFIKLEPSKNESGE